MIFQIEKCRMHYETLNIHEWQKQKHFKKDGKKSGSTCLQPIFIKLDFGYTTRSTTKQIQYICKGGEVFLVSVDFSKYP